MPWSRSRPPGSRTQVKYTSPEHRQAVAAARAQLAAAGSGLCAEQVCVRPSRLIAPGMDLHLCHERSTGQVLGLGHAECNLSEAGRYGREQQQRNRTSYRSRRYA